MEGKKDNSAELLFRYLGEILYNLPNASLDVDKLDAEHKKLGEGLAFFCECLRQTRSFALELSKGNLDIPLPPPENELAAPLKTLHAALTHVTWQTQQVAKGDYQQHVDFMGGFSEAFNTMVQHLDERESALEHEIMASEKKTKALEQNYALLTEMADMRDEWIVIVSLDGEEYLFTNAQGQQALGSGIPRVRVVEQWVRSFLKELPLDFEPCCMEKSFMLNDVFYTYKLTAYPVNWQGKSAAAFILEDVSDQTAHLRQLEKIAYVDYLTRLYNRTYGMQVMKEWLEEKKEFCLCFADLDNLKYVNDCFGHVEGDTYIKSAAKLLQSFSPKVVACRLGGDEFMLLESNMSRDEALVRMEELRDELGRIEKKVGSYVFSMSYGVVEVGPDNTYTVSELLSRADEEMYRYKRAHKDERFQRTGTKRLVGE